MKRRILIMCKLGLHDWCKSGFTPNGWVDDSDETIRHCVYCDLTQCNTNGHWTTIPRIPLPPLPTFDTQAKLTVHLQSIIKSMAHRLTTIEGVLYEYHANTCEKCGHKISRSTFFKEDK